MFDMKLQVSIHFDGYAYSEMLFQVDLYGKTCEIDLSSDEDYKTFNPNLINSQVGEVAAAMESIINDQIK